MYGAGGLGLGWIGDGEFAGVAKGVGRVLIGPDGDYDHGRMLVGDGGPADGDGVEPAQRVPADRNDNFGGMAAVIGVGMDDGYLQRVLLPDLPVTD